MYKKIALAALDYIIVPICIFKLLFDPNFLHGFIVYLEAGQYLSWASGIFDGKVPYKDFFILFGPFQLYAIAFALVLFGKTIAVLRTYFYVGYLLSFLLIYVLSRQVCRTRIFACLATFACLVEVSNPFWATRWDFGRMGLGLLVLILVIVFLKKDRTRYLVAAGIASAIALFYSPDIGIFSTVASMASLAISSAHEKDWQVSGALGDFLRRIAWYAAGFICVAAPFLIFLASKGALLAYLKTSFYIIPKYHMAVWGQPIPSLGKAILESGSFLTLMSDKVFKVYIPALVYPVIFIYLAFSFFKKRWGTEKTILSLLCIYGMLTYQSSFRAIMATQFQVVLPAFFILIAFFLERAFYSAGKAFKDRGIFKIAGLLLAATLCLVYFTCSPKRYYGTLEEWMIYQRLKNNLVSIFNSPMPIEYLRLTKSNIKRVGTAMIPDWQAKNIEKTIAYIEENTRPDEPVFCFPEYGLFNFLARRPYFSRFYIAGFAWTTPEWRKELLDELATKKPRIVVLRTKLSNMAISIGRTEEIFPEILEYVYANYHETAIFGDIAIYMRNDDAGQRK